MQRWFFLEDKKRPKFVSAKSKPTLAPEVTHEVMSQLWTFTVSVTDVGVKEKVFLTGSTTELGEWNYTKITPLQQQGDSDLWSVTVTIPNTCDVYYRYGVFLPSDDSNDIVIKHWETIIVPRVLKEDVLHPFVDIYGKYDGKQSVTTGWLTTQTLLQFRFSNNPLKLKTRLSNRILYIKVTPVNLTFGNEHHLEESVSADTVDGVIPAGVQIEVSTLHNNPSLCILHPQEQFGREYKADDILLFNIKVPNHKILAYLIDFFTYSSHAATDDPPCHIGYTYILPNMFKPSQGALELPVTCNVKHRPLGTVNVDYLIIYPMQEQLCDLKVSYAKYWDPSWTGLEVGHRGLGASFKKKEGNTIRENTIASLKKAAASGADLLEFDVQLSKDLIPVIYHDYHVCISMARKKEIGFTEMLELPVKDLTLDHLQKLKVYHLVESRSHETLFHDDDLEEHQPFPTLENVLNVIDPHVGFNVELKWTMEMNDGTFELNNPFDINTYVDKILEVVLKHAGERRIVFSCFNPDICTMLRCKQNKYPVMFLTVGITAKYEPYRDPRCLSIPAAVQNAISTDILGIVVHTEDLLRDPTQVKLATDAGLVIFCWGDDNNDKGTITKLKNMGLHAVIYDKLDVYSTKEVKVIFMVTPPIPTGKAKEGKSESIFLVEARESQREMMRLALEKSPELSACTSVSADISDTQPKPVFNLSVREALNQVSTATSLESLASSVHEPLDKCLKRNKDLIQVIGKESQVKEQVNSFKGIFPCAKCEPDMSKKPRTN